MREGKKNDSFGGRKFVVLTRWVSPNRIAKANSPLVGLTKPTSKISKAQLIRVLPGTQFDYLKKKKKLPNSSFVKNHMH